MSHLYPHLRLHQVFGANTDVGKTIFTTALCLASAALPVVGDHEQGVRAAMSATDLRGEKVHYVKPVSTGPMEDSDDSHINTFSAPTSQETLLRFSHAVSPHLAARLSKPSVSPIGDLSRIPTDAELTQSISRWIADKAALSGSTPSVGFVETAGGPHSPSPTGTSQVNLLRPLRLPTILIGDSNLGGISTTKSAYESLLIAGHQIDAILLFTEGKDDKWGNADYLTKWGQHEAGVPVWGLAGLRDAARNAWGGPPDRAGSKEEDVANMRSFYRGLVYGRNRVEGDVEQVGGVVDVIKHLRHEHQSRIRELDTLASRTRESCWWPFTQHRLAEKDSDVMVIDSAYGDFFSTLDQNAASSSSSSTSSSKLSLTLDGSASWWTQCLGHSHPGLAQTAARAAGRYGHVLFPMAANAPALNLSETLLGRRDRNPSCDATAPLPAPGTGWADRVFFSDNGATGMEVAFKMAIASARRRYSPSPLTEASEQRVSKGRNAGTSAGRPKREWKILGLTGSYHGDTIGAMDACEPSIYSKNVDWYKGRGEWIDPPSVGMIQGRATVTLPSSADVEHKTYEFGSLQEIYDVGGRLARSDPLASVYRKMIRQWLERLIVTEGNRFGALVIEPIILGAGGMIFVDPLFQRVLVDVVRDSTDLFSLSDPPLRDGQAPSTPETRSTSPSNWRGVPVIFDEVFTGLYRLGHATPSSILGTTPDISVLAKILTGGLVPMSVTLASSSIFDTFSKDTNRKVDALLHGHSYTAHPIGCEVANETLRILGNMESGGVWDGEKAAWGARIEDADATTSADATAQHGGIWSFWSPSTVEALSHSNRVSSINALGCVLSMSLQDPSGETGYASTAAVDLLAKLRLQGTQAIAPKADGTYEWKGTETHFNIHARPLGNVVYFMCSLNTPKWVREQVEVTLKRELGVGV